MKFVFFLIILFFGELSAHALCVITSKANLRSGPGPKYALTWTVPRYMPLIELKKVGSWYHVEDMDGETHYVYGSNVSRNSKLKCMAVNVPIAKLRKGPGSSSQLADIRQVDKYTSFKRIDAIDEWYQVVASWGELYWIHESNIWRPLRTSKIRF